MTAVKFFARLDLDQIFLFLDGHYLREAIVELAADSRPPPQRVTPEDSVRTPIPEWFCLLREKSSNIIIKS